MDSRAQSTVVATVLLVAIVFIVGGTIFVAGSNTVGDTPRTAPSTALNLDMNSSSLVFTHLSGESLNASDTVVVLNGNDGSTERIRLSDAVDSDADERLTVGESVTLLYTASTSSYTVYLVDEASKQPIGNWRRTVSILGVDLGTNGGGLAVSDINSDSSTDGSATVTRNGRTVEMKGNRWAETSKQYTITPDTTLSVTFESDVVCEIHAVGFADTQDEDRMIRLAGTQNWGTNVTAFGEPYYQEGSGRVRYQIPIGSFYAGNYSVGDQLGADNELTANLVLTNDCDDQSGLVDGTNDPADVESTYSGIDVST
ncbi:type IV pilin N-terminal domain-containing protein [Halorubrum halophilum]|uniref:type IV pilin N-terminal domain-containing protein n=1 Tax=Halorubrum halophilum TaxID=413816 RepID=UPI00186AD6AF|nr:type IV pilin N-terminal domain-containing protein [Halorubrum halophilum]